MNSPLTVDISSMKKGQRSKKRCWLQNKNLMLQIRKGNYYIIRNIAA